MIGFVAMFSLASALTSAPMEAISGDWVTKDNGAIVRLEPCPDDTAKLCGAMVWISEAYRDDEWIGRRMIDGFQFEDGAWKQGRLTNPRDGKVYRGSITLVDDEVRLKGCALRIFCKTETWSRAARVPEIGEPLTD